MQIVALQVDHAVEDYGTLCLAELALGVFLATPCALTEVLHIVHCAPIRASFIHGHRFEELITFHPVIQQELLKQTCIFEMEPSLHHVPLGSHDVAELLHVLNFA